jgi:ribosomal protein L13E
MRYQINNQFKKATPIGYHYNSEHDDKKFAGTGFFYYSQYEQPVMTDLDDLPPFGPYLITNKHIVEPTDEPNPDEITIYLRDENHRGTPDRHHIPLYIDDEPVWFEHPDPNVDVAMILLDYNLGPKFTYTRYQIPQNGDEVSGGDFARVIGYPNLLPEFRKFPIIRDALISSPFGVSLEEAKYFYFDARLSNGMSGSPVVYLPPEILSVEEVDVMEEKEDGRSERVEELSLDHNTFGRRRARLLGIHSDERIETKGDLPYEEMRQRLENLEQNEGDSLVPTLKNILEQMRGETGLNVAWHANIIEEIREKRNITDKNAIFPVGAKI